MGIFNMHVFRIKVGIVATLLGALAASESDGRRVTAADVLVTADPATCLIIGICDEVNSQMCRVAGSAVVLYRVHAFGGICATAVLGQFHPL
jgi:hypothetical protein